MSLARCWPSFGIEISPDEERAFKASIDASRITGQEVISNNGPGEALKLSFLLREGVGRTKNSAAEPSSDNLQSDQPAEPSPGS